MNRFLSRQVMNIFHTCVQFFFPTTLSYNSSENAHIISSIVWEAIIKISYHWLCHFLNFFLLKPRRYDILESWGIVWIDQTMTFNLLNGVKVFNHFFLKIFRVSQSFILIFFQWNGITHYLFNYMAISKLIFVYFCSFLNFLFIFDRALGLRTFFNLPFRFRLLRV